MFVLRLLAPTAFPSPTRAGSQQELQESLTVLQTTRLAGLTTVAADDSTMTSAWERLFSTADSYPVSRIGHVVRLKSYRFHADIPPESE